MQHGLQVVIINDVTVNAYYLSAFDVGSYPMRIGISYIAAQEAIRWASVFPCR
jgi:hypothetical protein